MPREGEVLPQDELARVADAATGRKRRSSDLEEIGTGAGGQAEGPHFVRAKAEPAAESGMFETDLCDAPRFGPRSQSRVLHFRSVVESVKGA